MSKVIANGFMYQFSTRKNFLDILLEPTSLAILASIALHGLIAANLAMLFPPEKPGKTADPGLVKVLELNPNEIQRIPQAPQTSVQPLAPTPLFPDVLPPLDEPITTVPSPTATEPGKITTTPKVVPSTPQRTTPTAKPSPSQSSIAQKQPSAPQQFDPNPFPSKSPTPKGNINSPTPKPSPSFLPSPSPKPTPTQSPSSSPGGGGNTGNDSNQGDNNSPSGSSPSPQPTNSPTTSPNPVNSSNPSPNGTQGGSNSTTTTTRVEGDYQQKALAKTIEFQRKYPGIKVQRPVSLKLSYPAGTPCSGVKSAQFIVYMVAFDRSKQQDDVLGGGSISDPIDKAVIGKIEGKANNGEALGTIALQKAIEQVQESDNQRSELDRSQQVLYQYKVQYDASSCKN
jgi:hypothetical protein